MAQLPELASFPETLVSDSYGLGLAKDSPLTEPISAIIQGYEADGTLDALAEKCMRPRACLCARRKLAGFRPPGARRGEEASWSIERGMGTAAR